VGALPYSNPWVLCCYLSLPNPLRLKASITTATAGYCLNRVMGKGHVGEGQKSTPSQINICLPV